MAQSIYRYTFPTTVPLQDVESSILLAIWGTESLHGEIQARLDASHYLDLDLRVCVVDARTEAGADFNRLFAGFLRREFGDDAFKVERIDPEASHVEDKERVLA